MLCCPVAEPPWFNVAMARVLASIYLELAWLSEKIDAVEVRLLEKIKAVEVSNARIWRMASIVSLTSFFFIPFSLKECRTGTNIVE